MRAFVWALIDPDESGTESVYGLWARIEDAQQYAIERTPDSSQGGSWVHLAADRYAYDVNGGPNDWGYRMWYLIRLEVKL